MPQSVPSMQEAAPNQNVCNVDAPDLIGPVDCKSLEQMEIKLLLVRPDRTGEVIGLRDDRVEDFHQVGVQTWRTWR